MSNNRLFFGCAVVLMISVFMLGTASAASMQAGIGEYENTVDRDSIFIVPVSVTSDSVGTVSVVLYPADGLSCDTCVQDIVFDAAGTEEVSFTVSADNTGIYENPFDIEISMDGSVLATATSSTILTVDQAPFWMLSLSSDKEEISTDDIVSISLSIAVTGPIDGVSAYLDIPSGWSIVSGNRTYDLGKVTGTYNVIWNVKADDPASTDDFSVTVTSSDPSDQVTKTISLDSIPAITIGPVAEEEKPIQGNHQALPSNIKKEAVHRPNLIPGTGLRENTKLQAALENALGIGKMDQDAIGNMMRISESISSQISLERNIEVAAGRSNMHMSIKYDGENKVTGFVLYDTVPKSFALSAKDITVTASGARVEIVEDDPEFAFIFDSLSPGDTIDINYEINSEIDADIVSSFTAEVYAAGFEDDRVCAQVMTPAMDSATGECVVYPTPCDVPEGWDTVGSCPFESIEADNASDDLEPTGSSIYKYMMIMSLLGIVGMVIVLRKNKDKQYSY
ncbi:MAG: hypothetical protein GQ477_04670 [Nanohaloarchaea archaeon]|nr:hypothetical protein [Candidatus Nanohaloarchaea archaeon]